MKTISIVGGCYNELENIPKLYQRCKDVIAQFPEYDYEFVFEDNCSTDGTRDILRELAAKDRKVKVILNANNFGHIRSPFNAFLNASGDVIVAMCTDLQEPPEVIADFLKEHEKGAKVVVGVRAGTKASFVLECGRRFYYWLLKCFAPNEQIIPRFTGFGLYDRCFLDALKKFKEPYPYFRGLVSEIGFKRSIVTFVQEERKYGVTKNNWMTLYDMAMTGFVNHTKLPLRLATITGLAISLLSGVIAVLYLILKLCFWDTFSFGLAPMVIGMFFLGSVQLFFIGVIGEYVGSIWTQVRNRPLVIEEERLNFD